jgi:hypothetical protein
LILEFQSERLVGHISRDSTAINAREKAKNKRGRPKKGEEREPVVVEPKRLEKQQTMDLTQMLADLPTACDIGAKTNAKGHMTCWKGYKLHGSSGIPVVCLYFIQ